MFFENDMPIFRMPFRSKPRSGIEDTTFCYSPLRDQYEFRLLTIGPKTTNGRNVIHATLEHYNLASSPLYTAVSYMWGPPGDTVNISLNGHQIQIQRNLSRILLHLQGDRHRTLWIDAICIDQSSIAERGHQVKLMGEIYHRANYVVACLLADRAMDRRPLFEEARHLHKIISGGQYLASTTQYRLVFGNRYFTRRWIIQEISMAQSVILNCEGYSLPFSTISDAICSSRLETVGEIDAKSRIFTPSERQAEKRAVELCHGMVTLSLTLESLLYAHESAECSDFHDKVFALLFLCAEARITPDYNLDRAQLMLNVLRTSSEDEGLSVFRVLSFKCFLFHHLGVTQDELHTSILRSTRLREPSRYLIQGTVRGSVTTTRPGPNAEETAIRLRRRLPDLFTRQQIYLRFTGHEDADIANDEPILEIYQHHAAARQARAMAAVSGIDQCLFSFKGNHPDIPCTIRAVNSPSTTGLTRNMPFFVGFATTNIQVGDQVWQFDRTPVALVARPTEAGYTLVGRALLIRDLNFLQQEPNGRNTSRLSEADLVWVKDGTLHAQATPPISLDLKSLHELMTWVSFDA